MSETVVTVIGIVLGSGFLVALVNYLSHRRTSSGRVSTTTADKLWDAAEGIREEMAERIKSQDVVIERLEARLQEQTREVEQVRRAQRVCHEELAEVMLQMEALKRRVESAGE